MAQINASTVAFGTSDVPPKPNDLANLPVAHMLGIKVGELKPAASLGGQTSLFANASAEFSDRSQSVAGTAGVKLSW